MIRVKQNGKSYRAYDGFTSIVNAGSCEKIIGIKFLVEDDASTFFKTFFLMDGNIEIEKE